VTEPIELIATKEEWGPEPNPWTNFDGLQVRLSMLRAPNYDPKTAPPAAESAEDLHELLMRELDDEPVESMLTVILNSNLQVTGIYVVARGSEDSVETLPVDVIRPVIASGSNRFIVVHNHPAQPPEPSADDFDYTRALAEVADLLGLEFVDDLIIGDGDYFSMADEYDDFPEVPQEPDVQT